MLDRRRDWCFCSVASRTFPVGSHNSRNISRFSHGKKNILDWKQHRVPQSTWKQSESLADDSKSSLFFSVCTAMRNVTDNAIFRQYYDLIRPKPFDLFLILGDNKMKKRHNQLMWCQKKCCAVCLTVKGRLITKEGWGGIIVGALMCDCDQEARSHTSAEDGMREEGIFSLAASALTSAN